MKTLLSLSIALLSLNLYGAEKPIISKDGLEGWGSQKGVGIFVEDYSDIDKKFDKKAIENQVELKLRLAGIEIAKGFSFEKTLINMQPIFVGGKVMGYSLNVQTNRTMTFKYGGKEYIMSAICRDYGGVTSVDYRKRLDIALDQLLLDYLKANPKPKEKKSLKEP